MPDIRTPEPQQQTICEREGHEYQFGFCVDCDQRDPALGEEDGAPWGVVVDNVNFSSYAGMGKAA